MAHLPSHPCLQVQCDAKAPSSASSGAVPGVTSMGSANSFTSRPTGVFTQPQPKHGGFLPGFIAPHEEKQYK